MRTTTRFWMWAATAAAGFGIFTGDRFMIALPVMLLVLICKLAIDAWLGEESYENQVRLEEAEERWQTWRQVAIELHGELMRVSPKNQKARDILVKGLAFERKANPTKGTE